MGTTDPIQARILVVDDEPANVRLLERMLAEGGYRQVKSTTDSRQVLALAGEFQPDLILLDLMMPHLDGIAVIQRLQIPDDVFLPILVLTADATSEAKKRALEAGAKDFLTKPFDRLEVMLRIQNLLDTRSLYLDLERHNRALEQIIAERTQRLVQSEKVATMGSLLAVVLTLAHDLPVVWADGHQIHQVVVNLVVNAIQAMRPLETPRRLSITTAVEREPARVSIEVADTGPGIPPEVQARIFEPFFTTQPEGEGTGLGLALARGIVEGHGGAIRVESRPGEGARFLIELPVETPPVTHDEPEFEMAL